jgi:membrane protein
MVETGPNIVLEPGGTDVSTSAGGARRYRKPLKSFCWCDIKALLGRSFSEWNRHKGPRLGASLAFYTLLSLTPLLLIVVSIGGLVFGRQAAQSQIVWQMESLVGPPGAKAVQALLDGTRNTTHGVAATVIGLLTLLFGASGVLIELRDALNTIWEIPPDQGSGFQDFIQIVKERLFSFALVVAIGFLLLVSLAINAWISALGVFSAHHLPVSEPILHVANSVLSFVVITGLFAAIYRILPDAPIEWRDVLLGAAVTSFLFTLGKLLIGLYLGKASFASAYGAAGSIVVLIVWVYYSGQIFFLGAEFTKVFATQYGSQPHRHPEGMVVEKAPQSPPLGTAQKIIAPYDGSQSRTQSPLCP